MKSTIQRLLPAKAGRRFLFILALVFAVTAIRPAMADTICIANFHAYHNIVILSATKDSITIKLHDNRIIDVPLSQVSGILKTGSKIYVCRNDLISFTAYFKSSDESGYTFASGADGAGEFTVPYGDIYLLCDKTPEEFKPPGWLQHDVFSLIFAVGFFQGVFLALMLFRRKKGNQRANRILSLFVIAASVPLAGGFLTYYLYAFPYLTVAYRALGHSAFFLIGPLLYFYTITLTRPKFRPSIMHGLHLLPACAMCIYFAYLAVMLNSEQLSILFFHSCLYHVSATRFLLCIVEGVQPCIYVFLSMRFLASHHRRIKNVFSSTEKLTLSWLSYIIRFMLGTSILWLAAALLVNISLLYNTVNQYYFFVADAVSAFSNGTGVLLALLFFAIGYRGLAQPEIFAGIPDDLVEEPAGEHKISISPEKTREIMDRVTKVMDEEKPYLDPGLSLPTLADMAGVSRNHLSQAINEHTRQNFYDFVNFYRVETAKQQLKDPGKHDMSVLRIAFDAGFNTKATFNAVFKKSTGLTPTEYRKNFEAADRAVMPETASLQ